MPRLRPKTPDQRPELPDPGQAELFTMLETNLRMLQLNIMNLGRECKLSSTTTGVRNWTCTLLLSRAFSPWSLIRCACSTVIFEISFTSTLSGLDSRKISAKRASPDWRNDQYPAIQTAV